MNSYASYEDYLRSPEWQGKRSERLRIDQFKCQNCGRPMDLQVHHVSYDNIGNENVYTDLVTLCKYCHEKIEADKKEYKQNVSQHYGYREDWKSARRLELLFCKEYEQKDITGGGSLNMMNMAVERNEWSKWLVRNNLSDRKLRVTTVIDYFRNIRIRIILSMSEAGASPDEIMAKGISQSMVKKYYKNRELAEAVMKYENLEDLYAETE